MSAKGPPTLADYYPAGMSDCDRVGMAGGCGPDCPAYLRGECDEEDEVAQMDEELMVEGAQSLLFAKKGNS